MSKLDDAVKAIEKAYGKGSIWRLGDEAVVAVEAIPTGSVGLDVALGIGGVPRGRIVEVYGPESCLDSETFVHYELRTPDGKRQNHKGGTIKRLFHRFHGIPMRGKGNYQRPQTVDSNFYIPSVNAEGRIFANKIVDVVSTGEKECYEVTTKTGQSIIATKDHKFYTDDGFVSLENLNAGGVVYIHNNTPYTVTEYNTTNRQELCVKHHPFAPTKIVKDKERGYANIYKRIPLSRAAIEADMNNLSLDEYKSRLNNNEMKGLLFLPTGLHVHHIDNDHFNNELSNLQIMTPEEHGRFHSLERHNNLRFIAIEDDIVSISYVGNRETYDIRVESPFNNYVANQFVVHNSGKTTLATHIIAEAQKLGGQCAMIDAEHAFDPTYAEALGVDIDNLMISQPDTGEQALDICEMLVRSGELAVVVVDSVAALVPKAEIEGDMGDSHMGLQARLMSQAMRKLTGVIHKTKTCVVFINQIRDKIGVSWGSPETTSGGRALKFYASVRLDIRRIGSIKEGANVTGNRTRVKVVKNKVAAPFKQVEFDIIFGRGIDNVSELIELAIEKNVITKKASWFSYGEDQIGQGKDAVRQWLLDGRLEEFETNHRYLLISPDRKKN